MDKRAPRASELGFRVPLLKALAALAACSPQSGGQTGEDQLKPCIENTTHVPSVETTAPLGFSANQILGFATAKHQSTLLWRELDDVITHGDYVTDIPVGTYTPGPGEAAVSFSVAYDGGDIGFVDREQWPNHGYVCNDELMIEAVASLSTSDGALDETFPMTLVASSAQQADWQVSLPWWSLKGSFRMAPNEPLGLGYVVLRGSVTPESMAGHFNGMLSPPDAEDTNYSDDTGDAIDNGYVDFADWPAAAECDGFGLPLDVDIVGYYSSRANVSANDVLALINDSPNIRSNFATGEQPNMTLRVSPEGQVACVRVSSTPRANGAPTLNLLGRLHATTDNASLNTDLPVRIEALPDWKGGVSWVNVVVDGPFDSGVAPAELWSRLGYDEADQSAYAAAACSFFARFEPLPSGLAVAGQLSVFRYIGDDCVQSTGSDGCVAEQFESVWWATP